MVAMEIPASLFTASNILKRLPVRVIPSFPLNKVLQFSLVHLRIQELLHFPLFFSIYHDWWSGSTCCLGRQSLAAGSSSDTWNTQCILIVGGRLMFTACASAKMQSHSVRLTILSSLFDLGSCAWETFFCLSSMPSISATMRASMALSEPQ
jgi:hypothetical protein